MGGRPPSGTGTGAPCRAGRRSCWDRGRRAARAFKWLRIIYRCRKDGKPYDKAIYMQSLHRRGLLLAGVLGPSTAVGWKSVASFQKLSENNACRISSEDSAAP